MKKCKFCKSKCDVMMKVRTEEYINGKIKKKKNRWLCPKCFLPIGVYLNHFDICGSVIDESEVK